jgi:hypothetical protein
MLGRHDLLRENAIKILLALYLMMKYYLFINHFVGNTLRDYQRLRYSRTFSFWGGRETGF